MVRLSVTTAISVLGSSSLTRLTGYLLLVTLGKVEIDEFASMHRLDVPYGDRLRWMFRAGT
jgi:hypothetical protein